MAAGMSAEIIEFPAIRPKPCGRAVRERPEQPPPKRRRRHYDLLLEEPLAWAIFARLVTRAGERP